MGLGTQLCTPIVFPIQESVKLHDIVTEVIQVSSMKTNRITWELVEIIAKYFGVAYTLPRYQCTLQTNALHFFFFLLLWASIDLFISYIQMQPNFLSIFDAQIS